MGKLDECDMEAFGRLFVECSEEPIAILGDRLGPQTEKHEGHRISNQCSLIVWKMHNT